MRVDYTFGENVIFKATLNSDKPVIQGLIFIEILDTEERFVKPVKQSFIEETEHLLSYQVDQATFPLPAFSRVEYHFQVMLEDGEIIHSPVAQFDYLDNRYEWQSIHKPPYQVNWIEGDQIFAQKILDAAEDGTRHIESFLTVSQPKRVVIYVYPGAAEMQAAFTDKSQDWVAGHAQVSTSKIIVSLPPELPKQALIDQRIPHELMHIYLSNMLESEYANLPAWLVEGLASAAELSPNPDYEVFLQHAYQNNQLLPVASLCTSFPSSAVDALGAYAQSTAFVSYLYNEYGREGLEKLVRRYADGASCEEGVQLVFGASLNQVERRWRQDQFGENTVFIAIKQLLPWLLLFVIIMAAPIGLLIFWFSKYRKKPVSTN